MSSSRPSIRIPDPSSTLSSASRRSLDFFANQILRSVGKGGGKDWEEDGEVVGLEVTPLLALGRTFFFGPLQTRRFMFHPRLSAECSTTYASYAALLSLDPGQCGMYLTSV